MARKPRKSRKPRGPSIWQRLRNNFFTGLVIVAPVMLTAYIIWGIIRFIDNKVVPFVPDFYNPSTYLGQDIAGFGVVIFLIFTTIVGAFTKGLFGRSLLRAGESIVDRMPVVRSIYNGLKQIVETVLSQSKNSFQNACLIEYPRKGIWAIAFVSTETKGEVDTKATEDELLSVFLPTTPNPTSGFLLFVPKKDVIILDMTVEEAAKLVISAGLVVPPEKTDAKLVRKPAAKPAKTRA